MAIQDAGSISEEIFEAKAPYLIPTEDETEASCETAKSVSNDVIDADSDGLIGI